VIAIHHYLIRYGRPGFVGRFASELPLSRGDRAVVQGPRGVEFGEVLVAAEGAASFDGAVLRDATSADDAESERLQRCGQELLASASTTTLPLAFVDVEVTLDHTAILHALAWDACDATPFLDELAARFGLAVRLLDLGRTPVAKDNPGCGKPGCGTEGGSCSTCGTGGGCSTGSCSRGAVKSPEELTAYFAQLRHQMEDAGLVHTPLN
jgi:cell fate regulator YaaT (PSP1 superfamily)